MDRYGSKSIDRSSWCSGLIVQGPGPPYITISQTRATNGLAQVLQTQVNHVAFVLLRGYTIFRLCRPDDLLHGSETILCLFVFLFLFLIHHASKNQKTEGEKKKKRRKTKNEETTLLLCNLEREIGFYEAKADEKSPLIGRRAQLIGQLIGFAKDIRGYMFFCSRTYTVAILQSIDI